MIKQIRRIFFPRFNILFLFHIMHKVSIPFWAFLWTKKEKEKDARKICKFKSNRSFCRDLFLSFSSKASQKRQSRQSWSILGHLSSSCALIGNHFLSPFRLSDFLLPNILQVEQVLFNYRNEKIFHKKTRWCTEKFKWSAWAGWRVKANISIG